MVLEAFAFTNSKEVRTMDKPIFRRFELTCGEEQKKAFLALVKQKGLNHEDLMLILRSVKIRSVSGK